MTSAQIEKEIAAIKERNARVEADKAWETSWVRKASIAILTYLVISSFFLMTETPKPFLSAIVPTLGFLLSTLSLDLVRKYWMRNK
jgi:hypothetical protein